MSEHLTVSINGEDRELFMSYGLLNELSRILGSIESIADAAMDPVVRDEVLIACLSERSKTGKLINRVDIDDLGFSVDTAGAIIEWASEHVLDFFMKRVESANRLAEKQAARIKGLTPSSNGTEA